MLKPNFYLHPISSFSNVHDFFVVTASTNCDTYMSLSSQQIGTLSMDVHDSWEMRQKWAEIGKQVLPTNTTNAHWS